MRYISEEDLTLFERVKRTVERMREPDLGLDEEGRKIILSCHMLARAAAKVFPVRVRDGYFAVNYQHSWVETPGGHLVDLYPVAVVGGPIMFEGSMASPQCRIYRRLSARKLSAGRFGKNSFRRSVRRITRALKDAQLGMDAHQFAASP
ncbi:MAG: hypothetical protein UZ00_C0014G0005 [Parcubacteria group bacterium GW2011_GWA1_60_11]|nr:MAG: hypothetical protein UZ00_C0014G0005 [Parcubacteria group bacterium GW2011_GWA1_60_11]